MEAEPMQAPQPSLSYIHLNVGGTFYTTSLSTLNRYPDSMLAIMFNQEDVPLAKDETGRYIIDRDGATFRYVLNFLRGGNLNLPPTFCDYYQLKEEVDFYQLDDMKELLELWRIRNWKEPEQSGTNQSERYTYHTNIGKVKVSFHLPQCLTIQSNPDYFARFCPKSFYRNFLSGTQVLGITQKQKLAKPDFEDDLTSFRYMQNYLHGKGNYMPNNQEELRKLKEVADLYKIQGLSEVLNHTTILFPSLKFTH